jgi:hypothetical protein
MMYGHRIRSLGFLIFFAAFLSSSVCRAQTAAVETKGVDSGNYNIQQSIEFGYRATSINGNTDNYDTFINLGSGFRLFDYTVDVRSLDHKGVFFDQLDFSNFGYGGDPNDVSRLRISKNKLYDFSAMFRRDKYFWDYNLLANPLNFASSSPEIPITNSPHAMDLAHRMGDYNLTLFPQSHIRFRLGYSHDREQGPGFFTTDSGTIPAFNQANSNTVNAYRMGVDFRILPRTTFSYDQVITYYRQDNIATDQNFPYQLAGGTPVDLGIIWSTNTGQEPLPCSTIAPNPPSVIITPSNTVEPTCNGFLSYSQVGRPRNYMPTERFSFQSTYFKNFAMSGGLGYSSSDNTIADFLEQESGWTVRTSQRGETTSGPAEAKRVSVNANWSGTYAITEKFRLVDEFRYDNWRIPGQWATAETALFGTLPPVAGEAGMQLPIGVFSTTNCPAAASFTGPNCPVHGAASAADVTSQLTDQFLAQNLRSNTFELEYEFTHRFTAHVGYLFTARTIADMSDIFDTGDIYQPGGGTNPNAVAANDFFAARGNCLMVAGVLPAGCVLNSDGSISFGSPTNPLAEAANDLSRNITNIHANALLAGFTYRPMDTLRITGDFEFGYNDASFTRTSPRQVQVYKLHAAYTPRPWLSVDGAIDVHQNRDNVYQVNDIEHGRTYSFVTILAPNPKYTFELGYNYNDIYSQADVCFAFSTVPVTTVPFGACPITGSPVPLGALGFYSSKEHFAHADVIWKPVPRVTTALGYAGTFVGGNTLVINPLQPAGSLAFNYQKPYVSIQFDLYKGLSYKTTWNYYGYDGKAPFNIAGLAPIGSEDFNGNAETFSLRYIF